MHSVGVVLMGPTHLLDAGILGSKDLDTGLLTTGLRLGDTLPQALTVPFLVRTESDSNPSFR